MHVSARGALAAAALACIPLALSPRGAVVTIQSETGASKFGVRFAARGSLVVAADLTRGCVEERPDCSVLIRIERVQGTRIIHEARVDIGEQVFLPRVAVRGDRVVVRPAGESLRFYEPGPGGWRMTRELQVDERCTDPLHVFDGVHLGDSALVVEGRSHWCVYEPRGRSWQLALAIAHDPGTAVTVSRDRMVVMAPDHLDTYARTGAGWQLAQRIAAPSGAYLHDVVASDRWVVTTSGYGDHGRMFVYDLDGAGRLTATLVTQVRGDDRFAYRLGVSDATIVASGMFDQLWRFDGSSWSPGGLLDGPAKRCEYCDVGVGDLIWIGDEGVIRGFSR